MKVQARRVLGEPWPLRMHRQAPYAAVFPPGPALSSTVFVLISPLSLLLAPNLS